VRNAHRRLALAICLALAATTVAPVAASTGTAPRIDAPTPQTHGGPHLVAHGAAVGRAVCAGPPTRRVTRRATAG
jgi:hypothetical protein